MAMAETKAAQAHLRMLIAPAPWIPAAGVGVEVRWDGQKGSEGGEPARVQVQVVFYATQAATTGIATRVLQIPSGVGNLAQSSFAAGTGPLSHAHIIYLKRRQGRSGSALQQLPLKCLRRDKINVGRLLLLLLRLLLQCCCCCCCNS